MEPRTVRRLAALLLLLTVISAAVTTACIGLALVPRDGDVLPVLISGAVTALLACATILLVRRIGD